MHGYDPGFAAIANKDSGHRMIDRVRRMNALGESPHWPDRISGVSIKNRRRIKPSAAGSIEEPSTIVIRSIAPRLIAEPGVAA